MGKIKLFEEYYSEETPVGGYITVPSDFEDRLKGLGELVKRRSEFYSVPLNQMKVDLFYGIKWEIREWLDSIDRGLRERTQESYENALNSEIYHNGSGILKKFSGGKYYNIDPDDVEEVKSILWKYINETIPYNEVDYYYTYDLQGKLMLLLDKFLNELVENSLFDPEKGTVYSR